jgi:hypothetical protein
MNTRSILAAFAALFALALAAPASAQNYQRNWQGQGGAIHVVTQRGQLNVQRGERLFQYLGARPYRFRPGHTYIYTDRCNRSGCLVVELAGRRPVDRFFAPYIPRGVEFYGRGGGWEADNRAFRGSDRDWNDGRNLRRSESRDWRNDNGDDRDWRGNGDDRDGRGNGDDRDRRGDGDDRRRDDTNGRGDNHGRYNNAH